MQKACLSAIKKGTSPIAPRKMAKLNQPTKIGS